MSYTWMPPEASIEAKLVDDLFSLLVSVASFIFLGVTGTLLYSALFSRAAKYDISDGPPIEGNVTVEVVWTVIPFVIVMGIAFYSYQIYDQMDVHGPMEHLHAAVPTDAAAPQVPTERPAEVEEIEVLARQWAWEFRYPNANVSSTELHLPSDRRIRLALKADSVIHGFYVPAFRLKQDIIPRTDAQLEFTPVLEGTYRLRDSQYSGTYFAAMQADVVVQSPEDYDQWLTLAASQPPATAYNQAVYEYERAAKKPISAGWKSIPPAPAPVVNYAADPQPVSPQAAIPTPEDKQS